MGNSLSNMMQDIEEHKGIVYIVNSPDEFKDIVNIQEEKMEITYLESSDDVDNIKRAIREGNIDLLVIFESDFINKVNNYMNINAKPEVKTYYNPSEEYSTETRYNFVNSYLTSFENILLETRFSDLSYIKAFDIDLDEKVEVIDSFLQ